VRPPASKLIDAPVLGQLWAEQALEQLALALNEQALYGPYHPAMLRAVEGAAEALSLVLAHEPEFHLSLVGSGIIVNGRETSLASSLTAGLVAACASHAVDRIVFHHGVTALEVATLVCLLGLPREEAGSLPAALAGRGVAAIACTVSASAPPPGGTPLVTPADASLLGTYTRALGLIQESAQQARLGKLLNAPAARTLASQLADGVIDDRAQVLGLLSIRRHDEYTFQHSLNICILALALGMAMGLSRARLQELGLAALLHDVGKAWVPLEVLRKPGPLDEEEAALIRRHPVDGAAYLGQQPDLPAAAVLVAFQHHLRYDQAGYPKLRWPHSSNTYSLIVGIADAYEALTSERPYRRALASEEALRLMLATPPGQFEPRLLLLFAEMLGRRDPLGADLTASSSLPARAG
jgi:HD superfamily phosphohydrolase YqeK